MSNNYETATAVETGVATQMILGMKYIDPLGVDWVLGPGFRMWMDEDIDESDD